MREELKQNPISKKGKIAIAGMMFIPGLYAIFQRAAEAVTGAFRKLW